MTQFQKEQSDCHYNIAMIASILQQKNVHPLFVCAAISMSVLYVLG